MSGRRASDFDDPERFRPSADDLPLFQSWPEAPAVDGAEQRGLPLPTTLEARYEAWRQTPEGVTAFQWIATQATEQVATGATRLFIDRLAWEYRNATRESLNNTYRSLMARELVDTYPVLRGLFEMRQRKAG